MTLKFLPRFLTSHGFEVYVLSIIGIATFLRFVNFHNRWGLAYDQAQFAIVSRFALQTFQLPLLGPFSSGGPFQTGGEWYWLVMFGSFINPFSLISPWLFLGFLSVFSVLLMMLLGKELVGKKFGLIVGIFAAISSLQVSQSTNLTNQTPIILFSTLTLLSMVYYFRYRKIRYFFLQAFFIGIGTSVHLQAIALFPLLVFTFLIGRVRVLNGIVSLILGLGIPWIPVLIADVQNNFYNTKNMLVYYSHEQAQVSYDVLGRRWLTFISEYIPQFWSKIVGGFPFLSYILIVGSGLLVLYKIVTRNITKEWLTILLSACVMLIIVRYTKTPLFDSFTIFLNPFVLLVSAWFVYWLITINKWFGYVVLLIITSSTLITTAAEIISATNYSAQQSNEWRSILKEKFPNQKFAVYDYQHKSGSNSLPLVLYLDEENEISDEGIKIGVVIATSGAKFTHPVILGDEPGRQIQLLEGSSSAELEKAGWIFVNPSKIYNSTQNWFRENK